jgi:hypothetical protein
MTAFKFCHSGILIFGDGENIFNASFWFKQLELLFSLWALIFSQGKSLI